MRKLEGQGAIVTGGGTSIGQRGASIRARGRKSRCERPQSKPEGVINLAAGQSEEDGGRGHASAGPW